ncbi:MAG: NfeD family protein [Lachnospiraceae bacterium]|nr:NfeD family protein [Lachnospiraceae bacterium]
MEGLAIMWLIILVIMVIIEIATMGLATIWFAGGAVVAFLLAVFGVPFKIQVVVFLVVSFVMLAATRPIAVKHLNLKRTKTNIDDLVGKHAIVSKEINNMKGEGQIVLGGIEWTARSTEEETIISVDTEVEIVEIKGVKAIVKPMKAS